MLKLGGIGTGNVNQGRIHLNDSMGDEAIHLYDRKHNNQ